jgi:hypothetical protein
MSKMVERLCRNAYDLNFHRETSTFDSAFIREVAARLAGLELAIARIAAHPEASTMVKRIAEGVMIPEDGQLSAPD